MPVRPGALERGELILLRLTKGRVDTRTESTRRAEDSGLVLAVVAGQPGEQCALVCGRAGTHRSPEPERPGQVLTPSSCPSDVQPLLPDAPHLADQEGVHLGRRSRTVQQLSTHLSLAPQ